jgi:hypothetical protein
MSDIRQTIGLAEARQLARALRLRRVSAKVEHVRAWPIWDIRAAWLWIDLHDDLPIVGALRDLDDFLALRQGLRICLICGCTDDNPCLDTIGQPCSWAGDFHCSDCVLEDAPESIDYKGWKIEVERGGVVEERVGKASRDGHRSLITVRFKGADAKEAKKK